MFHFITIMTLYFALIHHDNFEINIEKLTKFSKSDFINELKKAKKTFSSFTPDIKKLNNFLNQSNLSIIK